VFTGIIQELGRVLWLAHHETGARVNIRCSKVLSDAEIGSSIAVNGACLTAVEIRSDSFAADLAPETLKRTNLGDLTDGAAVNLERPLVANARLDGHFVLGHVDGTAELVSLDRLGEDNWWLRVRVPASLGRYIVSKGSIAIDGISLTVAEIEDRVASFTIIPHTFEHTALHQSRVGARLNVEVDILAKHLEKLAGNAYSSITDLDDL
jgi:riboflavin synthase